MGNGDKFIKEINLKMEELDKYLIECDNKGELIPLEEIVATGLFDNIDEIEVFFFSFDGEYYATDVNYIKYLK